MKKRITIRKFLSVLGPGLVTGAADDDPSGIATYTVVGARSGTSLLWVTLLTWPLMVAVQMMCARIGLETGEGLAQALKRKFPRPFIILAALGLLVANTINIGADLSGMADAAQMLSGVGAHFWIPVMGLAIALATIFFHYQQIAAILKWLTLVLMAYIITAFIVHPHWSEVLKSTFLPEWPKGRGVWADFTAILGTTISPYLFFWQTSQETEIKKCAGKRLVQQRRGTGKQEILDRKLDVAVGGFVASLVMYFIVLSSALTLHAHGMTHIETSQQASEALKPLAGNLAAILYTVGIVGVGFLAIPTLAGSVAYAFAETFHWKEGLDEKFNAARAFYGVIIISIVLGMLLNYAHVNPVKALYWSAIVNGLLAPFLLVGILVVACDSKIMEKHPSSLLGRAMVALATVLMFLAGAAMFLT